MQKEKSDTVIINDQSMQKKLKQHDHLISHQNDDKNLVNLECENDDE
jgi:hypothetical protein